MSHLYTLPIRPDGKIDSRYNSVRSPKFTVAYEDPTTGEVVLAIIEYTRGDQSVKSILAERGVDMERDAIVESMH